MFIVVLVGLLALGAGAAGAMPDVLDGPTAGVTFRAADPNTMDTYIQDLLGGGSGGANANGTRYAGRVWADKTVFANGQPSTYVAGDSGRNPWEERSNELWLDEGTDGIDGRAIRTGEDFLHVFSTLGSSLALNERYSTPLDVVIVLDISGSMAHGVTNKEVESSRIYKTLAAVNNAIETLAKANPDNRIGIAVYGYTAAQYLPLVYPDPQNILKLGLDDTKGQGADDAKETGPVYLRNYGSNNALGVAKTNQDDGNFQLVMEGKAARADAGGAGGSSGHAYQSIDEIVGQTRVNNYWTSKPVEGAPDETYDASNVGNYTNLQAGIAAGGQMLANAQGTTWVSDTTGRSYDRVPVLMIMTDGVANTLCRSMDGTDMYSPTAWWNPRYEALSYNDSDYSICKHQKPQFGPGIAVGTVMTAAYYKAAIDNHYAVPSRVFGISVDTKQLVEDATYGTLNSAIIGSILNPSVAFTGESENECISAAHAAYQQWSDSSAEVEVKDKSSVYLKLGQLPEGTGETLNGVTKEDVEESIGYIAPGDFIETDSNAMTTVFSEVIASITSPISAPVGGVNSLGAENAITYVDPLGQAMELKNPRTSGADPSATGDLQMSLFGELYDYVRAGVYDHRWVEEREDFAQGWYLGDDPATAQAATATEEDPTTGTSYPTEVADEPTGFASSRDAWAAGWVYRLDEGTLAEFVPIDESEEWTNGKVYTVYRLALPSAARGDWRLNPAYGDASGALSGDVPGAYRLSDIRVWVEDAGRGTDGDGESAASGSGQSFMVNIPVDALPLQTASVTLGLDGGGGAGADPASSPYETNLDEHDQSTPLRLYYSVGVEDRLLNEDGVPDADQLEAAYGEVQGAGEIVFDANYFDRTGAAGGDSGNAVVTFTSTKTNGYYAFQETAPLYEIPLDSAGDIDRYPDEIQLTDPEHQILPDGLQIDGKDYPVVTNVLYSDDAQSEQRQPTTEVDGGTLRADGWYYIVIDYYLPPSGDTPGRPVLVRKAVKRSGSDFGAGDGSSDAPFGAHLCWYLPAGSSATGEADSPVPIAEVEGGELRLSERPGEGFIVGTAVGGLRAGAVAKDVRVKAPNVTGTAQAAHFPTIAHVPSTEGNGPSGLALSIFLGNNGTETLPVQAPDPDPDPDPTPTPGSGTTPKPSPGPTPTPKPDPSEEGDQDPKPDDPSKPGDDGGDEPGKDPDPGTVTDPHGNQDGDSDADSGSESDSGSGSDSDSDSGATSDSGPDPNAGGQSGTTLVPVPYPVDIGLRNDSSAGTGSGTSAKTGALAQGLRPSSRATPTSGDLPQTGDGFSLPLTEWMGTLGIVALVASLILVHPRH